MISNRSQQKNRLSQSQSAAYAHFTQLSPDSSEAKPLLCRSDNASTLFYPPSKFEFTNGKVLPIHSFYYSVQFALVYVISADPYGDHQ